MLPDVKLWQDQSDFYDFIETGNLYDDLSHRCRCEFKCGGTTFSASSNEQLSKTDARAVCNMILAKILYREYMIPFNPFVFERERFETLFTESDSGFSEPGISYLFEPRQWIKDFETKNRAHFAKPTKFIDRSKAYYMTVVLKSKKKP